MFITELDTFVKKFHQLWNDGMSAHLDLDTHAGDAWVGLRVRLGQVPGPLHGKAQSFHQEEVPRKESPSCQRRCARRAAAKKASTTITEAVEAEEVVKEATEEQTVADDAVVEVAECAADDLAVKANDVDNVIDEFCRNEEFNGNFLNDENSVSFRIIIKDPKDIEVFKTKVRQSFLTKDVDLLNQHFEVSGYEELKDQSKFYLKIKDDLKAIEAVRNLKSENILMRKIPKKKPNS